MQPPNLPASSRWLNTNRQKFDSIKWETMFVEKVLAHVAGIDFDFLHAQLPFKDADGNPRRCDFAILEGDDVRIAMEVDGYDKTGTGTGMTSNEFVDWQRREAALVSQGWRLLRFANTDVRDRPDNCQEHISLLLRHERESSNHRSRLAQQLQRLQSRLAAVGAESEKVKSQLSQQITRLQAARDSNSKHQQEQLNALRSKLLAAEAERANRIGSLTGSIQRAQAQLDHAQRATPLTADEAKRLASLDAAQAHIEILKKENSTMKTTIWAFAAVTITIIVGGLLLVNKVIPRPNQPESPIAASRPAKLAVTQPTAISAPKRDSRVGDESSATPVFGGDSAGPADPLRLSAVVPGVPPAESESDASNRGSKAPRIAANKAPFYVGRTVLACGDVAQVTPFQRGTYLSLDAPYPREALTVIIWENDAPAVISRLGSLDALKGQRVCALGEIAQYKKRLQLQIKNARFLRLMR